MYMHSDMLPQMQSVITDAHGMMWAHRGQPIAIMRTDITLKNERHHLFTRSFRSQPYSFTEIMSGDHQLQIASSYQPVMVASHY